MEGSRAVFLQKRVYNWSLTLPVWQRGLMRELCQGPLSKQAGDELLSILCDDPGVRAPEVLDISHLPADETEHGVIELREIRNLRNINRLAGDQTLRFRPGLNIVFGENGTGKSGYGRLCRRVCRAAEPGEVLCDVFDPGALDAPQTAEFVLAINGDETVVEVNLEGEAPRLLSSMTAFDASCAHVYISKTNTIEHTPRPLRLLKEMAHAQDALADALAERINHHRQALPALPTVAEGTTAAQLLARVADASATGDEIRAVAELSEAETEELKELEQAEAAIRSDQGPKLEADARAKAQAVQDLIAAIEAAWALMDDEALGGIELLRLAARDATAAADTFALDTFATQRLPGTGGEAWREMWEAARRFVLAGGGDFPDQSEDAACPLCQQDLNAAARERMRRFEDFVAGELRARADKMQSELAQRIEVLPDVAQLERTIAVTLAEASEEVKGAARNAVIVLADRRSIALAEPNPPLPEPLDLKALRSYANGKATEARRHASLADEAEQKRISERLTELRARAELNRALDDVVAHLAGLETIARWQENGKQLSTRRITSKISELSKLAITDRLHEALKTEMAELDPLAGRVELKEGASKGHPTVQFKLRADGREKVAAVLSTGEQTALAMAFFLAELRVANERSALILDDPVSSLDHQRREHVAARLVEEAKHRQVIVFTHDLVFVHYLKEIAAEADCEVFGQSLARVNHEVGVVRDELPWRVKSPQDRLAGLRHELKAVLRPMFTRNDADYEREAHRWLLELRKGYERLIENYLLAGVVERHGRNIRVRQLHKLTWTAERAERVDAAMKELSATAHQEPLGLHSALPRPDKLSALLDQFEQLCQETKPGRVPNKEASSVVDAA